MSDGGTNTGGGGATNAEFLALIPEDIRSEPVFRDLKDVGGLARGYHGQAKLIGDRAAGFVNEIPEAIRTDGYFADVKDVGTLAQRAYEQSKLLAAPAEHLVVLPSAEDAEGQAKLWNRLGRPEKPDGYKLTDPAQIPEGMSLSPESKTAFMTEAHALGLNQKQADALWQSRTQGIVAQYSSAIDEIKAGLARVEPALKERFGARYEAAMADLNLLVDHLQGQFKLGDALRQAIDATPGDSGIAIKAALAEVGALMREHDIVKGSGTTSAGALDPTQAAQQINAMWADAETAKALKDTRHPGHADAIAKMNGLYQFAYPEAAAAA